MFRLLRYLLRDEMPIWLSIVLAISAGTGAYLLAPLINQEIEFGNNRASHISKTVDNVNVKVVELAKAVRVFNNSLFYQLKDRDAKREIVLDRITELQWLLIDVDAVITREKGPGMPVKALQGDLSRLYEAVQNSKKPEEQEVIISEMRETAVDARTMLSELYVAARLK